MTDPLPFRLSSDQRSATWNPALTRASHVIAHVAGEDGVVRERRSMNSGRVRVREGERIVDVVPDEAS